MQQVLSKKLWGSEFVNFNNLPKILLMGVGHVD